MNSQWALWIEIQIECRARMVANCMPAAKPAYKNTKGTMQRILRPFHDYCDCQDCPIWNNKADLATPFKAAQGHFKPIKPICWKRPMMKFSLKTFWWSLSWCGERSMWREVNGLGQIWFNKLGKCWQSFFEVPKVTYR